MELTISPSIQSCPITSERLRTAFTYESYLALIDSLLIKGMTTGNDHSAEMYEYAQLNRKRKERGMKSYHILDENQKFLQGWTKPLTFCVITEGWCGDAAQIIPVLFKITECSPSLQLRLLLRDENLDIMDQFLTNGTRSIPKLIILTQDSPPQCVAVWGPRPQKLIDEIQEFKASVHQNHPNWTPEETKEQLHHLIHSWYAKDRGKQVQKEIIELLHQLN